jgi:hypothetical protein
MVETLQGEGECVGLAFFLDPDGWRFLAADPVFSG